MIRVKQFSVGFMHNNCYLVYADGQQECILIDPAKGYETIRQYAADLGLTVSAVLLTHGHFDHIQDMAKWEDAGATIYVHQLDQDKLHSDKNLAPKVMKIRPPKAERILSDGDVVQVGEIAARVLWTPGHSAGSVCYIIDRALFSGDTLFCESIGRTDFYDGNPSDMMASLARIAALDGDYTLYPGHEEQSTLEHERAHNIYLR